MSKVISNGTRANPEGPMRDQNMSSYQTNKNAIVQTRRDRTGKLRTETARRDNGALDIAISTDTRNNSTRVFLDVNGRDGNFPSADIELNGREARTLYLALAKHFAAQGKSNQYIY